MTLAVITVASHHFVVVSTYPRFRLATREFSLSLKLAAKTFRNKRGELIKSGDDKYFASATKTRSEVRYHINYLEDFKQLLRRHRLDEPGLVEWRTAPNYNPTKISLAIRSHFVPTEDQEKAINYIVDRSRPNNKAVIMQAGAGKTLTAMIAAAKQGELIGIFVEPRYIGQWLKAFEENCVIAPKRICVIGDDGTKSKMGTSDKLKSLINMAFEGPVPYDAIIVSSTTFRNYIEAYKTAGSAKVLEETEGYGVPPHLFMQHLGIGLRIIDEAHENFHFVFTLDLYTQVANSVALSATLFNDDDFLNKQINTAYPIHQRYIVPGFNKYVNAYSLHYSMREPRKIKSQGSMGYSHVEFEKSILKSRNMTEAYFTMVRESMRYTYDLNRQSGDRCLVYFATIDMCTRFTEFIRREYPYLDCQRFCEEDPLENLLTADISV